MRGTAYPFEVGPLVEATRRTDDDSEHLFLRDGPTEIADRLDAATQSR